MSEKSYKAFKNQIESGKKETDAIRIYKFIDVNNKYLTSPNKDSICDVLKMKHQTVTARLSELMDIGVVEIDGKASEEHKDLSFFKVQTNPQKIVSNQGNRSETKFIKWVSKGKSFNISKSYMLNLIRDNY
jgi:hypothetical protein